MEKQLILAALKKVREHSPKRKFVQSVDVIINLKGIDLKKSEQAVNFFVTVPYARGKKVKACALVGPELLAQAKSVCDAAISIDEFAKYQEKKAVRKLAEDFDFFIAQATIMPKIASAFGRVFGPKGKMPNPKAGCVVPPNANLKPLYEKLQKTVRLQTKNDPIIMAYVGNEGMKDEELADNIHTIVEAVLHSIPKGLENLKNVFVKFTMGASVQIGETKDEGEGKPAKVKKNG
ncbi:50S ribosomal protein L1 [Candidatus Woesearchaeota archaeon]|nr:50S ribosomal protein L1 [Candidatus Woesearchaeota archaeon]